MKALKTFGQWALVTGASSGLGEEFATQIASQGLNVVLLARRKDKLESLAKHLTSTFKINTMTIEMDLTQEGCVDDLAARTKNLDIGLLVSNAGAGAMGAFVRNERSILKSMLHLNVIAQMELAHTFATRFINRQKKAGILMLSSAAAMQGVPYGGNYSGAKAYIMCLGESLNYELRKKNINVTVLIPGPTNTPGLNERSDVDLSKMPGPVMNASAVVKEALTALIRNKATHVAGIHNRILTRIMPRKAMIRVMGGMMRKHTPAHLMV